MQKKYHHHAATLFLCISNCFLTLPLKISLHTFQNLRSAHMLYCKQRLTHFVSLQDRHWKYNARIHLIQTTNDIKEKKAKNQSIFSMQQINKCIKITVRTVIKTAPVMFSKGTEASTQNSFILQWHSYASTAWALCLGGLTLHKLAWIPVWPFNLLKITNVHASRLDLRQK